MKKRIKYITILLLMEEKTSEKSLVLLKKRKRKISIDSLRATDYTQ